MTDHNDSKRHVYREFQQEDPWIMVDALVEEVVRLRTASTPDTSLAANLRALRAFESLPIEARLQRLRDMGLIDENNDLTPKYGGPVNGK